MLFLCRLLQGFDLFFLMVDGMVLFGEIGSSTNMLDVKAIILLFSGTLFVFSLSEIQSVNLFTHDNIKFNVIIPRC